jgi:hypothetical protein
MQDELKQRATRAIIGHAFFRIESALTIAMTVILIFLYPSPFPWWQWWYWLILGLLGETLIVYTSIRDERTGQEVVADMFRERFNPAELQNPQYRDLLDKALEYRRGIEALTQKQSPGMLKDYLANSAGALSDWLANILRVAKRLEAYQSDKVFQNDLKNAPKEIQNAEARLKLETSEKVRAEIRQMIASKKAQQQNLEELKDAIEKAEFQMQNSLTALGTLYSQFLLLDAKKMDDTRARGMAQSIQDQVAALQNIVTTMDEVYGKTI